MHVRYSSVKDVSSFTGQGRRMFTTCSCSWEQQDLQECAWLAVTFVTGQIRDTCHSSLIVVDIFLITNSRAYTCWYVYIYWGPPVVLSSSLFFSLSLRENERAGVYVLLDERKDRMQWGCTRWHPQPFPSRERQGAVFFCLNRDAVVWRVGGRKTARGSGERTTLTKSWPRHKFSI